MKFLLLFILAALAKMDVSSSVSNDKDDIVSSVLNDDIDSPFVLNDDISFSVSNDDSFSVLMSDDIDSPTVLIKDDDLDSFFASNDVDLDTTAPLVFNSPTTKPLDDAAVLEAMASDATFCAELEWLYNYRFQVMTASTTAAPNDADYLLYLSRELQVLQQFRAALDLCKTARFSPPQDKGLDNLPATTTQSGALKEGEWNPSETMMTAAELPTFHGFFHGKGMVQLPFNCNVMQLEVRSTTVAVPQPFGSFVLPQLPTGCFHGVGSVQPPFSCRVMQLEVRSAVPPQFGSFVRSNTTSKSNSTEWNPCLPTIHENFHGMGPVQPPFSCSGMQLEVRSAVPPQFGSWMLVLGNHAAIVASNTTTFASNTMVCSNTTRGKLGGGALSTTISPTTESLAFSETIRPTTEPLPFSKTIGPTTESLAVSETIRPATEPLAVSETPKADPLHVPPHLFETDEANETVETFKETNDQSSTETDWGPIEESISDVTKDFNDKETEYYTTKDLLVQPDQGDQKQEEELLFENAMEMPILKQESTIMQPPILNQDAATLTVNQDAATLTVMLISNQYAITAETPNSDQDNTTNAPAKSPTPFYFTTDVTRKTRGGLYWFAMIFVSCFVTGFLWWRHTQNSREKDEEERQNDNDDQQKQVLAGDRDDYVLGQYVAGDRDDDDQQRQASTGDPRDRQQRQPTHSSNDHREQALQASHPSIGQPEQALNGDGHNHVDLSGDTSDEEQEASTGDPRDGQQRQATLPSNDHREQALNGNRSMGTTAASSNTQLQITAVQAYEAMGTQAPARRRREDPKVGEAFEAMVTQPVEQKKAPIRFSEYWTVRKSCNVHVKDQQEQAPSPNENDQKPAAKGQKRKTPDEAIDGQGQSLSSSDDDSTAPDSPSPAKKQRVYGNQDQFEDDDSSTSSSEDDDDDAPSRRRNQATVAVAAKSTITPTAPMRTRLQARNAGKDKTKNSGANLQDAIDLCSSDEEQKESSPQLRTRNETIENSQLPAKQQEKPPSQRQKRKRAAAAAESNSNGTTRNSQRPTKRAKEASKKPGTSGKGPDA